MTQSLTRIIGGACAAALLTACGTHSETAMHNRQIDGFTTKPLAVNAHVGLNGRVSGDATVTAYQFLFFKFGTGGKRIGYVETPLLNKEAYRGLKGGVGSFLLGAPVDPRNAIAEAYYSAIDNTDSDYLVETRAKVEMRGFSFFGLIGYGKAAATVTGHGMKLLRGAGTVALRDYDSMK